eukprot:3896583-Rhodomonas_salina.3
MPATTTGARSFTWRATKEGLVRQGLAERLRVQKDILPWEQQARSCGCGVRAWVQNRALRPLTLERAAGKETCGWWSCCWRAASTKTPRAGAHPPRSVNQTLEKTQGRQWVWRGDFCVLRFGLVVDGATG